MSYSHSTLIPLPDSDYRHEFPFRANSGNLIVNTIICITLSRHLDATNALLIHLAEIAYPILLNCVLQFNYLTIWYYLDLRNKWKTTKFENEIRKSSSELKKKTFVTNYEPLCDLQLRTLRAQLGSSGDDKSDWWNHVPTTLRMQRAQRSQLRIHWRYLKH